LADGCLLEGRVLGALEGEGFVDGITLGPELTLVIALGAIEGAEVSGAAANPVTRKLQAPSTIYLQSCPVSTLSLEYSH